MKNGSTLSLREQHQTFPPVTRFEHFLNKIRLAIARKSDITSGLPAVTAEDNNKVLTVVDGAWDKAVPSGGGGGELRVHVDYDGNNFVLDKTWQEIYDALKTTPTVYIFEENESEEEMSVRITMVAMADKQNNTYFVYTNLGERYRTPDPDGRPILVE